MPGAPLAIPTPTVGAGRFGILAPRTQERGIMSAFWTNFLSAFARGLPRADDLAGALMRVLQALAVVALTLLAARTLKRWSSRLLARSRISPNVLALAGNAVFVLVLVLGISWLLGVFGASWTAVVASLSVVTVAISLSLQDVLKNLVAGVYLLLEQPFKIGDEISVKGVSGEIEGIDIRTTIIRTGDGEQVLVPNTIVFTEVLTNRSAYNTRKVSLRLEAVRAAFEELDRIVKETLAPFEAIERAPAPRVTIQAVETESVTIGIDFWQRGPVSVVPDLLPRLRAKFPEAKITILASGDSLAR